MGFFEKVVGFVLVPAMMFLLISHSAGIFRSLVHRVNTKVTAASFNVNGVNVNLCFIMVFFNLVAVVNNYLSISHLVEPVNAEAKSKYFEDLYRMYRNLLLNVTCCLLIFELWYNSRKYK
jgi:hypothetical protein